MRDYLEELLEMLQEDGEGDVAGELLALAAQAAGSGGGSGGQAEEQGQENRDIGPSQRWTEEIQRDSWADRAAFAAETVRGKDAQSRQRTDRSEDGAAMGQTALKTQETASLTERRQLSFQDQETVRHGQAQRAQESGAAGGLQEERGLEGLLPTRLQAGRVSEGQRAGALKDQLDQAQRANAYRAVPEGKGTEEREADSFFAQPVAAAPAVAARQVDRVFERDARRYDCGFTLF